MRQVVVAVTLLAGLALADIPPSDTSGCREKTAGAACKRDDGSDGTCAKATCSRNDYSEGPPPKSVSYECLKCGAAIADPPAEKKQSCASVPAESALALVALLLLRKRSRLGLLVVMGGAAAAFADDVPDISTARHLSENASWGWVGVAIAFLALCAAVAARSRRADRRPSRARAC